MDLNTPHPTLAKMLSVAQLGEVLPPVQLGEWVVILRLEKLIPAQLDDGMRQQIINHLFETWLVEEINKLQINLVNDSPAIEPREYQINQNITPYSNFLNPLSIPR